MMIGVSNSYRPTASAEAGAKVLVGLITDLCGPLDLLDHKPDGDQTKSMRTYISLTSVNQIPTLAATSETRQLIIGYKHGSHQIAIEWSYGQPKWPK